MSSRTIQNQCRVRNIPIRRMTLQRCCCQALLLCISRSCRVSCHLPMPSIMFECINPGPHNWSLLHKECGTKSPFQQSPIDIDTKKTNFNELLSEISPIIGRADEDNVTIVNTGHTGQSTVYSTTVCYRPTLPSNSDIQSITLSSWKRRISMLL